MTETLPDARRKLNQESHRSQRGSRSGDARLNQDSSRQPPPTSGGPISRVCHLDAGSISGTGACGACPCSTTDIAWRRRPTPAQSVSRVHLRCGHSFHSCCFISAAGRHPSEIDPHSSHASLTCPVCHVDFSADLEGLPARIAGYSGSSLSLLDSPSESASWSPPRQPQALPPAPVHVHPDTRPFTWCPLRCHATHEMCGHCWRWQEEGLAHVQSAHQ